MSLPGFFLEAKMKIEMHNVTKQFQEGAVAVDNFNATFEEGKLTALLGPSGCGKSTLLNMIAGILNPTEGTIYIGDKDVTKIPMEKRGVSVVFQNYALYPHMTALENICFPLEMQKIKKAERLEIAHNLAKLVKITEYLDRRPGQLSGGQQQRVAIARALAKKPAILLLDEPLSNLDARLRLEMRDEIRRIQLATKVTTIFVTHDQSEALSISDKIILMKKGKIQQIANPQEIYESPANQFVSKFMGTPPISIIKATTAENGFICEDGTVITYNTSKLEKGRKVNLGFRAESLIPGILSGSNFFAKVIDQYTIGRDDLLTLCLNGTELRAFADRDIPFEIGKDIPIAIRNRGFYVFDSETEARLL